MRKCWPLAFALFAMFIVALVLIANSGHGGRVFGVFESIPHYDKIGHFVLMGGLSFLAVAAIAPRLRARPRNASTTVVAVVAAVVSLEELSQSQFASRTFSTADLLFSLVGILLFGSLAHGVVVRRTRSPDASWPGSL